MTKFQPMDFTVSPATSPVEQFWGGGHTADTDPISKGWRCRLARGSRPLAVWIVGQRGVPGCASIRLMAGLTFKPDYLDVALYEEGPAEVERYICGEVGLAADREFIQFPAIPGVGLLVIRAIVNDRVSTAKWRANKA